MSKRKNFPNHRDTRGFSADPMAAETMFKAFYDVSSSESDFRISFADVKPFSKVPTFYRKSRPNFNDPIVLYYLLSSLVDSAPHTYIRAQYLAPYLNKFAPMFYWSVDIVGRMLAGIWETSEWTYLDEYEADDDDHPYIADKHGEAAPGSDRPVEIPYEERLKKLPFAMGRDGVGKYYVVDPEDTFEGRMWLVLWRYNVSRECLLSMNEESRGNLGYGTANKVVPRDFYRESCPPPTMSAIAHQRSIGRSARTLYQAEAIRADVDFIEW